ncbi:MAG TPA: hypothetical protein VIX63_10850 [Vicinamibacterales bacterium]
MIFLVGAAFAAFLALAPALGERPRVEGPSPAAAQQDRVAIVSVTPSGPVTRGVEVEFTFEVDVTLDTRNEAMVHLGFNADRPNSWKMVAQEVVSRGDQRVLLRAVVIPVDWRERGRFSALINIGPGREAQAGPYTPTASVSHLIEVVP